MTTKRQIVEDAFAELALAGNVFDLTPEELQTALVRLDRMLAYWESQGVVLGYAMPDPLLGSGLDDASGVPEGAVQTIVANLAVRMAGVWGKEVSQDTRNTAKQGLDALLGAAVAPRPRALPDTLPMGAGHKRTGLNPFFPTPDTGPMQTTEGGALDILEG
jgi:hypothetical protein